MLDKPINNTGTIQSNITLHDTWKLGNVPSQAENMINEAHTTALLCYTIHTLQEICDLNSREADTYVFLNIT